MPRRTSYTESKTSNPSSSNRAREVPSPPLSEKTKGRTSSSNSSASSSEHDTDDNKNNNNENDDLSEDEQERQERLIKKKSLVGLFFLTIAIGGAQIVASVLSALSSIPSYYPHVAFN